jgi:hypothetical protein
MRRLIVILLGMSVALIFGAGPATAQAVNIQRASASGPNDSGQLAISFRIQGLGANEQVIVTVTADATAVYACRNPQSGTFPNAANKQTISGPVSSTGTFTSGRNGGLQASLLLSPPASTLQCPPGQVATLVQVTYTNLTLTVVQPSTGESDTVSIPGTFSRTYFPEAL